MLIRPPLPERWRPVPVNGYELLYQVSNWGRVRSLPRWTVKGIRGGRILKQNPDSSGHLQVTLSKPGGRRRNQGQISVGVHRLVAEAFLPQPPPPGTEICHGKMGQQCNWVTNLRYDTHKANMADRMAAGRYANAVKDVCPHCSKPYTIRPSGRGRYCTQRETENRRRTRASSRLPSLALGYGRDSSGVKDAHCNHFVKHPPLPECFHHVILFYVE